MCVNTQHMCDTYSTCDTPTLPRAPRVPTAGRDSTHGSPCLLTPWHPPDPRACPTAPAPGAIEQTGSDWTRLGGTGDARGHWGKLGGTGDVDGRWDRLRGTGEARRGRVPAVRGCCHPPSRRRSRGVGAGRRRGVEPPPGRTGRTGTGEGPPAPGRHLERRDTPASAGGSGDSRGRSPPVPPDTHGAAGGFPRIRSGGHPSPPAWGWKGATLPCVTPLRRRRAGGSWG